MEHTSRKRQEEVSGVGEGVGWLEEGGGVEGWSETNATFSGSGEGHK